MFKLNQQLENDSLLIKELSLCQLRLLKDGELDWFLLIPQKENIIEWIDLEMSDQQTLLTEINYTSEKLREFSSLDKINIAAIGNMVSQFHLHIIARQKDDRAWPGTIWGTKSNKEFSEKQLEFWKEKFR